MAPLWRPDVSSFRGLVRRVPIFPAEFGEDDLTFSVPRRPNTMMIFDANGNRRDFALAPGEAKRIFNILTGDSVRGPVRDFRDVVPKVYRGEQNDELKAVMRCKPVPL